MNGWNQLGNRTEDLYYDLTKRYLKFLAGDSDVDSVNDGRFVKEIINKHPDIFSHVKYPVNYIVQGLRDAEQEYEIELRGLVRRHKFKTSDETELRFILLSSFCVFVISLFGWKFGHYFGIDPLDNPFVLLSMMMGAVFAMSSICYLIGHSSSDTELICSKQEKLRLADSIKTTEEQIFELEQKRNRLVQEWLAVTSTEGDAFGNANN